MDSACFIRFGRNAATLLVSALILLGAVSKGQSSKFNQPGNILITDQFNNRVVEIDAAGSGPAQIVMAS